MEISKYAQGKKYYFSNTTGCNEGLVKDSEVSWSEN